MAQSEKVKELGNDIWKVADLLRGDYKQSDYGKVILPLAVLRRLDCVLEESKPQVLEFLEEKAKALSVSNLEPILNQISGHSFHNTSKFTFSSLVDDSENIAANLRNYINGFSSNGREILEYFSFNNHITRLDEADLLYLVVSKFEEIDLHPDEVSPIEMGYIFEILIRKFAELSNETAGEHFTPREVIKLMVNLLLMNDKETLTRPGIVKTIYDPACGTGGMLSIAEDYILELNTEAKPVLFGQELNPESYAICKSDMLIKGQDVKNIKFGNTFTSDGLESEKFDYMLSNPPYGVEWRKVEKQIKKEAETLGYGGRFGAGLPRISDGSLLFLQHMISKMKNNGTGSRIGIVFNGSPLFSGGANSGESNIRQWIIENDWLEAIVALPDQMFYNTGIFTYVWILTNRKLPERKGKVQLINATSYFVKMDPSLGNKRNEIGDGENGRPDQISEITQIYGNYIHNETRSIKVNGVEEEIIVSKIFDNEDFGYWRITVERPLRLNFQVSNERLERLWDERSFANLAISKKKGSARKQEIRDGKEHQDVVISTLKTLDAQRVYKNREEFSNDLIAIFRDNGAPLTASLKNAILNALSEQDDTADICLDRYGEPESDSQLRDYENVPLKDEINEFFNKEVLPHVPDAWIDEDRTQKGYEINFNRYFYQYKPLRSLDDIQSEIMSLESELDGLLSEVFDK